MNRAMIATEAPERTGGIIRVATKWTTLAVVVTVVVRSAGGSSDCGGCRDRHGGHHITGANCGYSTDRKWAWSRVLGDGLSAAVGGKDYAAREQKVKQRRRWVELIQS